MVGLPISKLLGGYRDRIKAYASTWPNMGKPEDYAKHALACKAKGYKAYKVHAYIFFNPRTWQPAPQLPGFPEEDVEVCRAVREAVGDDMVLMLDPFGVYTLQEALWVGRELEKLDYYWLEHPMVETKLETYRRLTRELQHSVCSDLSRRGSADGQRGSGGLRGVVLRRPGRLEPVLAGHDRWHGRDPGYGRDAAEGLHARLHTRARVCRHSRRGESHRSLGSCYFCW